MANAPKPRIVSLSSVNVFGTSSETTSSVTAKANTASLKPSMREISWLRQRNDERAPTSLSTNLSRIIPATKKKFFRFILRAELTQYLQAKLELHALNSRPRNRHSPRIVSPPRHF